MEGYNILAAETFFRVNIGGQIYRHYFRRPEREDYVEFYRLAVTIVEREGNKEHTDPMDFDALNMLWDRLAIRVTDEQCNPLLDPADPNWKSKVPWQHRKGTITQLVRVKDNRKKIARWSFGADRKTVHLFVPQDGGVYEVSHHFRVPAVQNDREYRRLLVGSDGIERTPDGVKKVMCVDIEAYCRIWSELILGVDGYVCDGVPFTEAIELLEQIDAPHKRTALDALFREDEALLGN